MLKTSFLVIIFLGLFGCVKFEVKAPESLVPDTINVGKEVYQSVREKIRGTSTPVKREIFAYRYTVLDGESDEEASIKCINFVHEKARKTLNVYELNVREVSSEPIELNGAKVVMCSINVAINEENGI